MRKLALWVIVFAAAAGGVLHAQTSRVHGREPCASSGRACTPDCDAALESGPGFESVMRSIDQGAQPINAAR